MLGLGLTLSLGSGRAPQNAWSPTDEADILAWYRADLGVTESGGAVSAWADQSGAGDSNRNATQATSGARPTLVASSSHFGGRAAISFNGTNNQLITGAFAGGPYAQPVTVYAVFRHTSSAPGYVYDGIDSDRIALYSHASIGFYHAFGGTPSLNTADNTTYVSGIVFNGASSGGYLNDPSAPAGTGDPGAAPFKGLSIGERFTGDTDNFPGEIAEMIVYQGAHDATTRTRVMNNLKTYYGL